MSSSSPLPAEQQRPVGRIVWLTLALFLSYLCVAMSLPATSVFVATRLQLGNAWAGLAVGIAFAGTILTRGVAGRFSDRHGGKSCMMRGLAIYAVAGLVSAGAASPGLPVPAALATLLAGRLLLGWGESLATVGLLAWALAIGGPSRSGQVFSLVGIGMYGAFAAGGPLGIGLLEAAGFAPVMGVCCAMPLLGLAMALPAPASAPAGGDRVSFWRVLGRIWRLGSVVGLQGIGFAALGAFLPLMSVARGWAHAGVGLTCFGAAFVLVRLLFGHLPDRFGGARVALGSLAIEAAGLALLSRAESAPWALAGAFLTGLGCSLVFPAMGREVVRLVPPQLRGTAAGGFAAFQDLAYGLTGPLLGLFADRAGYGPVFAAAAAAAFLGVAMLALWRAGLAGGGAPQEINMTGHRR